MPHTLVPSDRVEGAPVYGSDGTKIGTIERLMLDKRTGMVAYAVVKEAPAGTNGTCSVAREGPPAVEWHPPVGAAREWVAACGAERQAVLCFGSMG